MRFVRGCSSSSGSYTATAFARHLWAPGPFQNPRRPSPSPGRDYNPPGPVTSHLDPTTRASVLPPRKDPIGGASTLELGGWLPQLTQQTLVITGCARSVMRASWRARMPRAQIHRVHGGGRLFLFDRAAEVGPVVSAFLSSLERTALNEVAELG